MSINDSLKLAHGTNDPHWYLREADFAEMDRLLVRDQHPLAFVPGTKESRFIQLARVGHQFAA